MLRLPPLSLYVHIPWCVRKCPYCDFNSHQVNGVLPEGEYAVALERDLVTDLDLVQGRKLTSVFIGGGTPSLFSAPAIGHIVELVERHIGLEAEAEITLEANPGTFEQEKFRDFRAAGINRLSIGIQSFDNRQLRVLGRIHDRATAISAVSMATSAGFDNINLDLMHGLPGQKPADAMADLALAVRLGPTHISWYQLTIEPNTAFYSAPPPLPAEDALAEIQETGEQFLDGQGYDRYEVSAYARSNHASRHNVNYWQFGDYLGIGAGAHGKISLPEADLVVRTAKTRQPRDYLRRDRRFEASRNPVTADQRTLEFMMNALRLSTGVPAGYYEQRTGLSLDRLASKRRNLETRGLLVRDQSRISATALGQRFLNDLLWAFNEC